MKMRNGLAPIVSLVYDDSVASAKSLLLGNVFGRV